MWDRYKVAMEKTLSAKNPHHVKWAEVEPYLLSVRHVALYYDSIYLDCSKKMFLVMPGTCYFESRWPQDWLKRVSQGSIPWDEFKEKRNSNIIIGKIKKSMNTEEINTKYICKYKIDNKYI